MNDDVLILPRTCDEDGCERRPSTFTLDGENVSIVATRCEKHPLHQPVSR